MDKRLFLIALLIAVSIAVAFYAGAYRVCENSGGLSFGALRCYRVTNVTACEDKAGNIYTRALNVTN